MAAHARFASLLLALTLPACAHKSYYKETNKLQPAAVAADKVTVFSGASEVRRNYVELGRYRGKAPSVKEAVDAAKAACGKAGGTMLIHSKLPYKAGERGYKVEAVCAVLAQG